MPTRLSLFDRNVSVLSRKHVICTFHKQRFISLSNDIRALYRRHAKVLDGQARPPHPRAASTIPSVTAVNVQRELPAAFKELHASLKSLEQDAALYVNSSQLHLALRGLESEDAITRVAGGKSMTLS